MEIFVHRFMQCAPLVGYRWNDIRLSEECQVNILKRVFQNDNVVKYPPKTKYRLSFLKVLIKQIEEQGYEVIDEIYEEVGKLVSSGKDEREYSFKSYALNGYGVVTLKESVNLISEGTTGLHTWQAAYHLAEWAFENRDTFCKKDVLEVGSGCGFLGLVLTKITGPRSYTFTDCDDNVLRLLRENILINFQGVHREECSLGVHKLKWNDPYPFIGTLQYDVVIGTDVVYDNDLTNDLASMLHGMLSLNPKSIALIAGTIRNRDTYRHFLDLLDRHSIEHSVSSPPAGKQRFYYDRNTEMYILKLSIIT